MQQIQLKDLPKGEFFKRKADANKVYQRTDYSREAKKYNCRDMLDAWGNGLQLKGSTLVFTGFDYCFGEPTMTTTQSTVLTATDVVANLKARLKMAQRDYLSFPNATRWNVQTRDAFVYQQAFYFFNAVSRSYEDKRDCLIALSAETNGNWGDVICQHAFGMTLTAALREHANCP